MKRRDFMKGVLPLGLAPLVLNGIPVQTMASSLMTQVSCSEVNDRILVLIQLHGGNDGLNTLIPLDQYTSYRNYRPTVGIKDTGAGKYLEITPDLALHPEMGGIRDLYNNGDVNFIQDVGYDEMNRSHFKGSDLWLTGGDSTPAGQTIGSGWVGRYLDDRFPNYPQAYPNQNMPDPIGLEFGSRSISLAYHRDQGSPTGLAIGDSPVDFYNLISGVGGALPGSVPQSHYGDMLQYILDIERSGNSFAQRLNSVYNQGANANGITYPMTYHSPAAYYYNNELAPQLQTIARLIDGGLQTKVYLVRLTGFDTHSNQVDGSDPSKGLHAVLMYHLSSAIKAFFDDLASNGHGHKVVAATFSEFGRQVGENGSKGTDHGTFAPMMVCGKHINGGVTGNNPNLSAVSNNILTTRQFDYRQVLTTLLQDWMGAGDNALTEAKMDAYKTSKLPLVESNAVTPVGCYAISFPVGLLMFDAIAENFSRVKVNWQTATETNNDYFEVQRSVDGVAFESMEQVPGAGNSNSLRTYTTFDNDPHKGVSYYRLKQVDFDGTYVYHDPVQVLISPSGVLEAEVKLYPNPTSDRLFLSVTASTSAQAIFTLMNITGQKVIEKPVEVGNGLAKLEMDVSNLSPGIYHAELRVGEKGSYEETRLASQKVVIRR